MLYVNVWRTAYLMLLAVAAFELSSPSRALPSASVPLFLAAFACVYVGLMVRLKICRFAFALQLLGLAVLCTCTICIFAEVADFKRLIASCVSMIFLLVFGLIPEVTSTTKND